MQIEVRYRPFLLTTPYVLAFGAVKQFDTFFVRAFDGSNEGWGEITPLPGYSAESPQTVREALADLESNDNPVNAKYLVQKWGETAAMTVSGILTARDSLQLNAEGACPETASFDPIPVAALCAGTTPDAAAENAQRLCAQGYQTLKVKIGGGSVQADVDRVHAIAAAVSPMARLRLDANQQMVFDDARTRIIGFLHEQAAKNGMKFADETLIRHGFTHQDMANITGTSRQLVTIVLNELKKENLINFDRSSILIRDLDQLK